MKLTPTEDQAARTVNDAITRGVEGDVPGAAELLIPLMTSGVGTLYALTAMLAELAAQTTRPDQVPASFDASEASSIDAFPPEIVFASRFTTAWASHDHDQAETLFAALYRKAGVHGRELLAGAVFALFQMAVLAEAETARGEESAL